MSLETDLLLPASSRPIALRRRTDLVAVPMDFGRRRFWTIKDPVAGRFFQLTEAEYAILGWLDGRISPEDVIRRFQSQFAPLRLSGEQLQAFLARLHTAGLVLADAAGQGEFLDAQHRRRRMRRIGSSAMNLLAVRLPGINPQRALAWLYPKCRWMFSPAFVSSCVLLMIAALLLVTVQFEAVCRKLPDADDFFTLGNGVLALAVLAAVKVVHEMAHALVCQHFGGRCRNIGVMLLVGVPCLYCDVSDAWLMPRRTRRIAVSAAGMFAELTMAAAATFLWWFSEPGPFHSCMLLVMVVCSAGTVLVNGNPLLRYDGYYIASDLLATPNLRATSAAVVRRAAARWLLGMRPEPQPVVPQARPALLALYAIGAAVYRVAILAMILWMLHRVLRPHGLQVVATGLGSIAVAAMAIGPIGAAVSFAGDPIRRRRVRPARAAFSTSAAAACVVLVLAVPMRYEIGAVARIDPGPARPIYVTVPGRIVDSVAIGDRVSKGDRIATLANDELAVELLELTAQRDAQRLRLDHLRQLRGDDLDADNQIPTAASALADLESRLARRREFAARLTPAAPIGGVVLPAAHRAGLPESDNARLCSWSGQPLDANHRGAELETETMICRVGDPARFDAVAYVDQSDIEQVRVGDAVRFRRSAVAPRVWHGCVTWIDQQPIEEVPDALLSDGRLPVHTSAGGAIRPRGTWYQVRIRLDATAGIDVPLTLESCGDVKITVRPASLGQRFLRFLRSTFRLA